MAGTSTDEIWRVVSSAVRRLDSFKAEAALTSTLAAAVCSGGDVGRVWVARSAWRGIPAGVVTGTGWKETKTYDLSWAQAIGATAPDVIAQIKGKTKGAEVQQVLLFLSDVVHAAIDQQICKCGAALAVSVRPCASERVWRSVSPCRRVMTLTLDPANAQVDSGRVPWADPKAGWVRPTLKSQYNQLVGGGTNSKFVGLWHREGSLQIKCQVRSGKAGRHQMTAYFVEDFDFTGPGDFTHWWP
jgi:hypothetical protein